MAPRIPQGETKIEESTLMKWSPFVAIMAAIKSFNQSPETDSEVPTTRHYPVNPMYFGMSKACKVQKRRTYKASRGGSK